MLHVFLLQHLKLLALKVDKIINDQVGLMSRSEIITESLEKYGLIIVAPSIDEAVKFSNKYAPEHLIIMTEDPEDIVDNITNAGSIFLGELTPVSAGDYGSGTNHVLTNIGMC